MKGIKGYVEHLMQERIYEKSSTKVGFTVSVDEDLNRRLEVLSKGLGMKKAALVRDLLSVAVQELEEELNARQVRDYFEVMLGKKSVEEFNYDFLAIEEQEGDAK